MGDAAGQSGSIESLAASLRHYDPSQLYFQVAEIAGDRSYLRHGIEVSEGDVVLDVGANVGVAAVFFASCGAAAVHSFEPVRPLFELLRENVAEWPACTAHPYGLGAESGTASITYYPGAAAMSGLYADSERDRALVRTALLNLGFSAAEADRRLDGRYEGETMSCELRTLSRFLGEAGVDRVDLLKIDVERAELDVLAGIAAADWPRIGQIVIEVHDEGGRYAAIEAALRERGYEVAGEQEAAMRGTVVRMLYAMRR